MCSLISTIKQVWFDYQMGVSQSLPALRLLECLIFFKLSVKSVI